MKYALMILLLVVSGCFSYNSVEKKPSIKEQYAGKSIRVFIFDDKTQLWNRATAETLQKADCGKIRFLVDSEVVE